MVLCFLDCFVQVKFPESCDLVLWCTANGVRQGCYRGSQLLSCFVGKKVQLLTSLQFFLFRGGGNSLPFPIL